MLSGRVAGFLYINIPGLEQPAEIKDRTTPQVITHGRLQQFRIFHEGMEDPFSQTALQLENPNLTSEEKEGRKEE